MPLQRVKKEIHFQHLQIAVDKLQDRTTQSWYTCLRIVDVLVQGVFFRVEHDRDALARNSVGDLRFFERGHGYALPNRSRWAMIRRSSAPSILSVKWSISTVSLLLGW